VSDSATTSPNLDEAARTATERADKGKKRDKRSTAPTEETKEFWETWAENKSTAPAAEPARAKPDETEAADDDRKERRGRDRGRGRDKKDDRHAKDDRHTQGKDDRKAKKSDKDDDRPAMKDDGGKKAAASDGNQARLFVSLGKKHGVSADDLRTLLAAPIGGDTARIGSVSLRDSHAHVRVPEDLVDDIIAGVHGKTHKDHEVTVERARA
jgi:hypothetical protein